ncbi:OmpA domain protein [Candidatus Rhodobacter oscarellae]|uniref:OmpA domain protein n=1 Tax=Candidatus Rhodobacter oscarellae TaxID=1675527 RepID=A0A0J9GZQ9_9RHOB|nr:phosphate ABC transporter substrate-binding/OmpA family protein [Candidatus Rhodobacter lobularis]KMW58973.1 OmpA domain protein [Candidatus Rhodobacter lobularis]
MRHLCAAFIAALLVSISPGASVAQDVTLTSRDGSVAVSGTLLSFDGELYRIDTAHGPLTMDGAGVLCDGPGCPDLTSFVSELRIAGSQAMGAVLMPALVETFAARKGYAVARLVSSDTAFTYELKDRETGVEITRVMFNVTSTAEGFADLIADEADLVLSTREVTEEERRLGRAAGLGDLGAPQRSRIVGLDGLVPIVARRNPLDAITMDDLAAVFAGKIISWEALGQPPAPLKLHLRDGDSGYAAEFLRRVIFPARELLSAGVTLHPDNASLASAVERDPHALGIAAFSDIGNAKPVDIVGSCGKRLPARAASLKTEDYPLTMPLFVYSPRGRPSPIAREFGAYIRSAAAQPVVLRAGFVDLRVGQVALAEQGQRLANAVQAAGKEVPLVELQRMVAAMDGTSRLTLSFRFKPGGPVLDAQSRSNVDILAAELERGRFDQRQLFFVGFSDGDGAARGNLRLARRRAVTVQRAVLRAAPAADRERLEIMAQAYGEAMPMACDEDPWGKEINRRVEVWVK